MFITIKKKTENKIKSKKSYKYNSSTRTEMNKRSNSFQLSASNKKEIWEEFP